MAAHPAELHAAGAYLPTFLYPLVEATGLIAAWNARAPRRCGWRLASFVHTQPIFAETKSPSLASLGSIFFVTRPTSLGHRAKLCAERIKVIWPHIDKLLALGRERRCLKIGHVLQLERRGDDNRERNARID